MENANIYSVIIVGSVCFTIFLTLFMLIKSRAKISAKYKDTGFELGGVDGKKHDENALNWKISHLIIKINQLYTRMFRIEFFELIEEQKRYIDLYAQTLSSTLIAHFQDVLREKSGLKVVSDLQEFKHYYLVTRLIMNETREAFYSCAYENHLPDKEGVEWEEYKRYKISVLLSNNRRFLDTYFVDTDLVSRDEIAKAIENGIAKMLFESSMATLQKLREISIEKHNDVERIKAEIGKICNDNNIVL